MKKYYKFLGLLLLQLFMFYVFPMFAGPTDAMGMVFIIIISTFILGFINGFLSNKIKYLYPVITSILFIPSVFIYYNESALVHSLWYFVVSLIGLSLGVLGSYLINKTSK
ncbi:MAG: hypothetical protein IJ501_00055 [Bacilli bacterium]|nr:hypothetical protein [Bacilli bacterium]